MKTLKKKVIAAIIMQGDKILIAQRKKQDELYGKWEFPGGKMEESETDEQCLKRELYEEFGINAQIGEYFCTSSFFHKKIAMDMLVYYVPSFTGEITLYDHQQIKWVNTNELLGYDFPEPDKPVIEQLLKRRILDDCK